MSCSRLATSARAYTLDVVVASLQGQPYEIHNLDPLAGERVAPGVLRVPKLDVDAALRKYGKSTWSEFSL